MSIARTFFLLQSTIFSSSGAALIFWPPASSALITDASAGAVIRAYNVVVGALLIFIGALLCTAGAASSSHVVKAYAQGSLIVAAAFVYYFLYPTALLNPLFLVGGAVYFAASGLLAFALLPTLSKSGANKSAVHKE